MNYERAKKTIVKYELMKRKHKQVISESQSTCNLFIKQLKENIFDIEKFKSYLCQKNIDISQHAYLNKPSNYDEYYISSFIKEIENSDKSSTSSFMRFYISLLMLLSKNKLLGLFVEWGKDFNLDIYYICYTTVSDEKELFECDIQDMQLKILETEINKYLFELEQLCKVLKEIQSKLKQ